MSLLVILGMWAFLGGSVYRARRRARSGPEGGVPGTGDHEFRRRQGGAEIPDTVPLDWVEAYRADNGG